MRDPNHVRCDAIIKADILLRCFSKFQQVLYKGEERPGMYQRDQFKIPEPFNYTVKLQLCKLSISVKNIYKKSTLLHTPHSLK